MVVVERLIEQVRPDKWAELETLDKKYGTVESRCGFPAKRRYRCFVGGDNTNTLIIERNGRAWPPWKRPTKRSLPMQNGKVWAPRASRSSKAIGMSECTTAVNSRK